MREQGADLIIIPFDSRFGILPIQEQQQAILELQLRARSANLAGNALPVWDAGQGRMAFIAPMNEHAFFTRINLAWIFQHLNWELSW